MPQILEAKETYTFDYPWAIELADEQNSVFWTHNEIDLSKDVQDILTELTPAEKHGVLTVLRLFVKYELKVNDYWGGYVAKNFPRPDIQRMASSFAFFETNVHAPFYNKINELLHLDTDEFYNSYVDDEVLKARVEYIDNLLAQEPLLSTAVFSMVEGAVLYSSFAYLKHFQSQGKNKMKNLVAGINFSTRDEHLHSVGGAKLHNQLRAESNLYTVDAFILDEQIYNAAHALREHEYKIAEKIFEEGNIANITVEQMKVFIDSRLNLCLQNIGLNPIFEVGDNPIAEWFYLGISSAKIHDFFAKMGNQYHRNWDERAFEDEY
jgi:ribonucleoside-diphosphate reductase beta chain